MAGRHVDAMALVATTRAFDFRRRASGVVVGLPHAVGLGGTLTNVALPLWIAMGSADSSGKTRRTGRLVEPSALAARRAEVPTPERRADRIPPTIREHDIGRA